jgi:hypothetical protein
VGIGQTKQQKKKGNRRRKGFQKKLQIFFFEKSAFLDFANQENWSVQGVSPL